METSKRGVSPSRYDPSGAYQRMYYRRSHNRKKLPFMSTGMRFEAKDRKKPGPADYDPWGPELTIKELPGKKARVEEGRRYNPPAPTYMKKAKANHGDVKCDVKCDLKVTKEREKKTDGLLLKRKKSALPKKFLKCFLRYPNLEDFQ